MRRYTSILRIIVPSIGLTLCHPIAFAASDTFSASQQKQIVRVMRDAMKSDPTILSDAIESLKLKAQSEARAETATTLNASRGALERAPDYAIKGDKHGNVTIVEFFDPRCGYCKRVLPVIDAVLQRDKKIRFIEKIVPVLSDKSVSETRAIIAAARQGGYEKMKRALMSENVMPTQAHLKEVAQSLGLDGDKLLRDMSSKEVLQEIQTNLDQARGIDLGGTPTFIFNHNVAVPGFMSEDDILREVKAARKS